MIKIGSKGWINIFIFFVAAMFIALVEASPLAESGASLMLTLLFWASVAQGCVAVVAVGEVIRAKWVADVREELLSVCPLILFSAVLFLLLIPFVGTYPWMEEQGIWLNRKAFMIRSVGLLAITYGVARIFSLKKDEDRDKRASYAVLYLFVFVLSQSQIAIDWVMSLSYPWYSTLLGGYFFIEALYSGIAIAGVVYAFAMGEKNRGFRGFLLPDLATLLFGFSLLWAGLFYAQFLVIWYGNIPEEVGFLVARVTSSPLRELSFAVLAHMFFIPFLVLIPGRSKRSPGVVFAVSISILSGLFIERLIFLAPSVTISPGSLVIEFFTLFLLFVMLVSGKSEGTV